MEAWELAYVNKRMSIPVAKEKHSGCSSITITQFGKTKEEAEDRYIATVDEAKRLSEPCYEKISKGYSVKWKEKACLEPKTTWTWKKSSKRYDLSKNKNKHEE